MDIVQSAERVLRDDPRTVYVIVGDGSERRPMEEECVRLRIRDRFRFVGWVDHDAMPEYLSLGDVVVMPSESEALALVYLETQASARTLVASDIPASREVVDHGRTGLLFRKGDVGDLVDKTRLAVRDRALRVAIGEAARAAASAHDLRVTVESYLAVLRDTAGAAMTARDASA